MKLTIDTKFINDFLLDKGGTLQYILYSDLRPRSKSQVKSQAKNMDKSKVKQ